MGNCCKKGETEELKMTIDLEEQKAVIKSPEDLEAKFAEIIKSIDIINPSVKVLFLVRDQKIQKAIDKNDRTGTF